MIFYYWRKAKDLYHLKSTITNKVVFNKAKEDFKTALIKVKNDWIHKKLEKLNTKESMIFWKQYQRIFLSDDENFIGNIICSMIMRINIFVLVTQKKKSCFMKLFGLVNI